MAWFENEKRLKNLSPQHKEVWTNAYQGKLGIESGAFQAHVADYLDKQDKALAEKVDIGRLTPEQQATHKNLENLKTALRAELKTFTAEIKDLPSNTLAEALANEATEEKTLIIEKLKLLNQQTQAFTKSLPETKKAGAADTTHSATSTPGPTTGARTGTGGDTSPWAGTGAGVGIGINTISDEEESLDTEIDADSNITTDKDTTSKTTDVKPMTHAEATALSDALDATGKSLEAGSTPELDELEKKLTGAITDMRRAAQLERDRIPLLAVMTANERKMSLFKGMINSIPNSLALFSASKPTPPSVLVTGDDQTGIDNLRKAFRQLDLSGQEQEALNTAKKNLEQAETRLKKAKEDSDQDNIDKYEKEIEEYNKEINKLNQKVGGQAQSKFMELIAPNQGFTSLSGRKINVGANDQGLTFQMSFPAPLFSPGYYLSREHNTKADLVCMAELIKATGAKNIYFNIDCRNPKRKQQLMQEAYEAALEVGDFESITINGEKITKENMHEKLYKHTNSKTKEETNKYQGKEQLAQQLQGIAEKRRSEVKQAQAPEIEKQQNVFKHAMKAERAALEQAAEKIKGDAPPPPSEEHGTSTTLISPQ